MKSLKETLMYIALCWVILYLIFSVGSATIFIQDMHGLVRLGLAVMMFAVSFILIACHVDPSKEK